MTHRRRMFNPILASFPASGAFQFLGLLLILILILILISFVQPVVRIRFD
jgi:hypothetical protein